jgi:arylsulfatase A-like enzyme
LSQPDVIVIVLDTARTFDVSAVWPMEVPTTPYLEAFAADSMVYPNGTTTAGWTLPAHASLFTGLMPSHHGAHELTMMLGNEPPTMAEVLGAAGYTTAAYTCNDLVGPVTGLSRGFDLFVDGSEPLPDAIDHGLGARIVRRVGPLRERARARYKKRRVASDHGGGLANEGIRKLLRKVDKDRPMFLFVNYLEAHLPYSPPDSFAEPFLPEGVDLAYARGLNQRALDHARGIVKHTEKDWATLRGLYRGAIKYQDELLRQMMADVEAARGLDGALVFITSDHGENLGEHGAMDHQASLHDTVLRIPFLVRFPGRDRTGSRPDMAQLSDVMPTVCDVIGAPLPQMDGAPLTSDLTRDYVIAECISPHPYFEQVRIEFPEVDMTPYSGGKRSVRTLSRKLIKSGDGRNQFYDLEADPYETTDVYGTHPDEAKLALVLREWERQTRATTLVSTEPSPELQERMRALGYID